MTSDKETSQEVANINELERLRNILYGEQAKATEDRIRDLQAKLEKIESEINAKIRKGEKSLGDQITSLDSQLSNQLDSVRAELNKELSKKHNEHTDQLRELRQQLVDISSSLEDSKVSRSDLGAMLVEIGQRLLGDSN